MRERCRNNPQDQHMPVLLQDVLRTLSPRADACYIDGTFGRGGYTKALLEGAPCRVLAIDKDPDVMPLAQELQDTFPGRFFFERGEFSAMDRYTQALQWEKVDGIVLDVGVSSPQLENPERGFSFRTDGPLDMRMSQSGPTAADIVNTYSEAQLAFIIWTYGEERHSRRIARLIVETRQKERITSTGQLAHLIYKVIGKKKHKIDPATRTFQALRIYVNKELEELEKALEVGKNLLAPLGRFVIVSFHSLEDRIVKNFFKRFTDPNTHHNKYTAVPEKKSSAIFIQENRKPITALPEETTRNPRARSAKLRWAIKV